VFKRSNFHIILSKLGYPPFKFLGIHGGKWWETIYGNFETQLRMEGKMHSFSKHQKNKEWSFQPKQSSNTFDQFATLSLWSEKGCITMKS